MREKILQMINDYWRFDNHQKPMSSWHDKQDLLKAIEEVLPQADVGGNEVAMTFEQRQCPSCKLNIQLEDKFCSHCGVKFKWQ